ncbi:MAG: DUF1177 domain-containing protein [Theionarchaea archaeon]|nr:DUF1177 domain-containing protein [Theionarchaea archaeon]MBU7001526.1 DUF1177 domain-containing protein [Theionarchaea archaeon]MBU7019701.1 DUF1177 domain-containing protein [Theionarchaea archaeon]MBU7034412.1 DUF1177 domain-containing protein [Theionarchaea archaeon]MBU7041249.1 DUF1177 domain-containing protein [Theionarchaea archaeon]
MLKNVLDVYEVLDNPEVTGEDVAGLFSTAEVETVTEQKSTDFVSIEFGSGSPTLGIVGQLGGIGAEERTGLVSDAEGALTALACALQLEKVPVEGRVIVTTHICPRAPIIPHDLVDFMGSPLTVGTMMEHLLDERMDAVLSVDTTRGNRIINYRGFALSPTVKEGWILRVSEDLLDIQERVTGRHPVVFPITMQDITPYSSEVYHLNAIMQPCTKTKAPVVGVGITSEVVVPGCATGANQLLDVEAAARFCVEVAKEYTRGACSFYSAEEFEKLKKIYGTMDHLQQAFNIQN